MNQLSGYFTGVLGWNPMPPGGKVRTMDGAQSTIERQERTRRDAEAAAKYAVLALQMGAESAPTGGLRMAMQTLQLDILALARGAKLEHGTSN